MSDLWFSYNPDYTWVSNKTDGSNNEYDLLSPEGRRLYYNAKAGKEIEFLREYLKTNTFVAYLLAPKNAGKGTYTKNLAEALGGDYFYHISVGDVVKDADADYREKGKESEVYKYAEQHYRGYIHLDEAFAALTGRSTANLVPTEFVLTLVKRVLDKQEKKTVFVDGFPRNLDQISYSLYFRELINYRGDPDIFVLISAPLGILDLRVKYRVVCPTCKTPRNLKVHPTKEAGYDEKTGEYFLICDNPDCPNPQRMIKKEGDELGIEPIKDRMIMDNQLMERARKLYGVPKIEVFNGIHADRALEYVDDYEITKEYYFEREGDKVVRKEKPLSVSENGTEFYSLLAPAATIQLIKQLYNLFYKG
jgi:adenylate kinase family enzyme